MATPKPLRPKIDPAAKRSSALRSALGRFATGVAVVTFNDADGARRGMTINSFTSVSLDPPLVLVNVGKSQRSHDALAGRPFTVNILGAEQQDLAVSFAGGPRVDASWVEGEHAPRINGVLAHLECTPWRAYDAGDHTIYLGQVEELDFREGDALGYLTSSFTVIPESRLGHEHLI